MKAVIQQWLKPSMKKKLLVSFLLVSLLPLLALGIINYYLSKDALVNANKAHLKSLGDAAYILAHTLDQQVQSGKLSKEEAQDMFRVALNGEINGDVRDIPADSPRIGTDDYFFAVNGEIRTVMHVKVELEGQILDKPNDFGVNVSRDMYTQKEGFYEFMWTNPGETEPRPKISYLRYFPEWDWVLVMGSYYDSFYEASEESKNVTALILLIGLVLVTTVSVWIASSFTKRINHVRETMEFMGQGDFTKRVDISGSDELAQMGHSLNNTIASLSGVMQRVKESAVIVQKSAAQLSEGASQLNTASTEIAVSIDDVSQGSDQQADNLQNISGYMEELAASFAEASTNVSTVNDLAVKAKDASIEGRHNIEETMNQMGSIKESVLEIQDVIENLNDRTKEIGNFVTVITDISSQTNLLALNAAIEAARAGESGRGFAVVAEEVRKLAEQSAQSAEEIKSIIESIMEQSERSRETVKNGSVSVLQGTEVVKEAGEGFDRILSYVTQVAEGIGTVNQTVREANMGAQEIAKSVTELVAFNEQMNAHTQNVAALIEEQTAMAKEMHSATEALHEQSNGLEEVAKGFRV
ncbi:methyl-accepting chemotaxis protein [Brevibacillus sp. TJ4]|uniref:methyl-accepting chemotaxis protein n=1 Tax=Brevibacillus sp. TJ4 TaxID=3234853 RepID=UPI0037D8898D